MQLGYGQLANWLNNNPAANVACPECGPKSRNSKKPVLRIWAGGGSGGDLLTYYCARCELKGYAWPGKRDAQIKIVKPKPQPPHNWDGQRTHSAKTWSMIMPKAIRMRDYLDTRDLKEFEGGLDALGALAQVKHPNGEYYTAMVGKVCDMDGVICALHVTYLTPDGKQISANPKKQLMTGMRFPKGGAIRLAKIRTEVLGIAEGIETALSVNQLFGVPCWAATSAAMLKCWQPPEGKGIKKVIVFGDNDSNGVGQKAAESLRVRLQSEGFEVEVRIPDVEGWDWNDVLMREGQNGITDEI